MTLEISLETVDLLTADNLKSTINDIDKMLEYNDAYHSPCGLEETFSPMYSYEYKEEYKQLNKIKKSMIKVYNWYSTVKYTE